MKRVSVKAKITVWLTILMGILAVLLLVFLLIISNSVAKSTAKDQLKKTVRENAEKIEVTEGTLHLREDFHFYQNGVTALIYSKKETLIAGQIPVSFSTDKIFKSGYIRTVDSKDAQYLVLDLWIASDLENGVWLRGVMETPNSQALSANMVKIGIVVLPVFMIMAAFGSFRIAKRAFRPLDHITATAEAINEARDLSGRIGLPPGKDEFSRLAADFDQMFERLEQSFEAEKQFTADASHELRTPVSIIKGACEYAEKYDETEEDRKETISMIHRQADKMANLISQLLSMTRIEQGIESTHMDRLNLGEVVRVLCEEQKWDTKRFSMNAKESVFVKADKELLSRLVRNLVENGFKYGKPNGKVWINISQNKEEVLLSVCDDGIGIPTDEQEKIWQRFYQVDPAHSNEESAGLGLSMVRQIARVHGGYMSLHSVPGEGSTFTLHLPPI